VERVRSGVGGAVADAAAAALRQDVGFDVQRAIAGVHELVGVVELAGTAGQEGDRDRGRAAQGERNEGSSARRNGSLWSAHVAEFTRTFSQNGRKRRTLSYTGEPP